MYTYINHDKKSTSVMYYETPTLHDIFIINLFNDDIVVYWGTFLQGILLSIMRASDIQIL